jgi:hypothetical protein
MESVQDLLKDNLYQKRTIMICVVEKYQEVHSVSSFTHIRNPSFNRGPGDVGT